MYTVIKTKQHDAATNTNGAHLPVDTDVCVTGVCVVCGACGRRRSYSTTGVHLDAFSDTGNGRSETRGGKSVE